MNISLSAETQKLLEERMKKGDFSTPDEAVRDALLAREEIDGEPLDQLDPETQAAIERAEAQSERGEGRPWEEVREELRARYLNQ